MEQKVVRIKAPPEQHLMFEGLDEELDFAIDKKKVNEFHSLWKAGISVENIAKRLGRKPVEIVLLIMDQEIRGYLEPREEGLEGL